MNPDSFNRFHLHHQKKFEQQKISKNMYNDQLVINLIEILISSEISSLFIE